MRKYLFYLLLSIFPLLGFGQIFSESFDDVSTLTANGWIRSNQSTTPFLEGWGQGAAATFPAHSGGYVACNYTSNDGLGTISNWLITPVINVKDGDVVKFYTRTIDNPATYPDRLQFRMGTGSAPALPSGPEGLGGFTNLLLDVNPTLSTTGYPAVWTQYSITVAGVGTTAQPVKFAFRYYVTDGGTDGINSDIIGVDEFVVEEGTGGPTDPVYCEPATTNPTWEWITNVNFAGIDNTTTGNAGLNDYTDQIAEVTADSVVPISVSIESDSNDYIWVFIDWNQNGILDDAGEVLILATATDQSGAHTGNINVPADALEGPTRMRVMLRYSFTAIDPDPCFSYTFGEIEDYTVNVTVDGGSTDPVYCEPTTTNPTWEWITNVNFAGIDNTTTGNAGLNDYTDQIAEVTADSVVPISVSIESDSNDYIWVFIDWNQNGILDDAGEVLILATATDQSGAHTGNINVPADALEGPTRMRVMLRYSFTAIDPDPCFSYTFGEIEDYTVNVTAGGGGGGACDTLGAIEITGNLVDQPLVCSPTDNLNSTTVTTFCGIDSNTNDAINVGYGNGLEATYTYVPTEDGTVTITVSNTTWAAIFVYEGCPLDGGSCVGATRNSGSTRTLTFDVTAGTEYFIWIDTWPTPNSPCVQGGLLTFDFQTTGGGGTFPAPYCGPIEFEFDVEPITNVVVADISNTSDATLNGSPEHEDFTAIVGNMEQGGSYDIALEGNTNGNFTNRFVVFIDWNQNDILDDAGEVYEMDNTISGSTGTDGQQALGTIVVPADAELGTTRMRVKKIFGLTDFLDPCLGAGFGQVEDYTINVTEGSPTDPEYCEVNIPVDRVEPITRVIFEEIDNSSSPVIDGSDPHEYFLDQVANVETNGSYPIALEGNTDGNFTNTFTVFIDWNQDGDFTDDGEMYLAGSIHNSTGTDGQQATGTIEVPADALEGTTRMRIIKDFTISSSPVWPSDPCGTYDFGQAEDYTLNVTEGTTGPGNDCSQATPSNGFENGHGFIHTAHIAHDFSVDAETTFTVEQFTFNILQQNPTATVTLSFYEETGGAPGAFIDTTPAIVPTSATTIGTAFGFNVVSTVVDLPAGFEFEGGATGANYFVAVNISNPTDSYWESTTVMNTPNTGYWSPDGGVTWTALTGGPWDGVFEIAGTCEEGEEPEPGDGCFVTGEFDQWPSTTYVAQCIGSVENITTAGWAGEFSKVQVTAGTEYIFASSVPTDFITIADEDEEIAFATGTGSVTWTSPIDQVIRFYTHLNDECEIEEVSRTRSVQCGDILPPPANDDCDNAIALSCGDSDSGTTAFATDSGGNAAGDVFYTFTGTGTPEMVTVSLCGSSYDTYLRVFTDCTLGTEIAFNDDSCGLQSQLTFMSDGTSTYVIMVEGFSSNTGNYTIDITCAAPPEFTCEEQEVLSNGLENGLFFGGDTDQSLAVDVIVGDEGFIVYGSYVNVFVDGNTDLTFSVNFYDDAAGVPGALVHSSNAYFTENEFLGNAFGFDVYSYLVGFDDPFTAEANTTYWMEIVSDGLAWEATSASFLGSGLVFSNTNTGGAWTLDPATELVYDLICQPLGVSDMNSFDFTYYPNPVRDVLNIDAKEAIESVSVFNLAGQKVMADAKVSNGQVDVNSLVPGTYVFRVTLEGGKVETFKIIKK